MAASCVLKPTVNGKVSTLYNDLLTLTKGNRKVTNLIYAISTMKQVRDKLNPKKDFNSQKEPTIHALTSIININKIIESNEHIKEMLEHLNAVNDHGKLNHFEDAIELLPNIIEFNKTHENYTALLQYHSDIDELTGIEDKYYTIDVQPIDSDNINKKLYYEQALEKWNIFNKAVSNSLQKANLPNGITPFDTSQDNYSLETKQVNNPLTLNYLISMVERAQYDDNFNIPLNRVSLVVDWAYNYDIMKKIVSDVTSKCPKPLTNKSLIKEEVTAIIKYALQYYSALNNGQDSTQIKELFEKRFGYLDSEIYLGSEESYRQAYPNVFLHQVVNWGLRAIDLNAVKLQLQQVEASASNTISNINLIDIKTVINDLNTRFHINEDLKTSVNSQINTVKELTERMFLAARKKYEETMSDKNLSPKVKISVRKHMKAIISNYESAEYAYSISLMLNDIEKETKYLLDKYKENKFEYDTSIDISDKNQLLTLFRNKASYLMEIIDFITIYKPLIEKIQSIDSLRELDSSVNESKQLLKEAAKNINDVLIYLDTNVRQAQYKLVYDFLKLYWGNEDIKIVDGEQVSLQSLLQLAQHDATILDRFVLSMGQCSDPVLGLVYSSIQNANKKRDRTAIKVSRHLSDITSQLYKEQSDSSFMYDKDENGKITGYFINPINFIKWKHDLQEYRNQLTNQNLTKEQINDKLAEWKNTHMEQIKLFENDPLFKKIFIECATNLYGEQAVHKLINQANGINLYLPNKDYIDMSVINNLSETQRKYYYTMIIYKHLLSREMPGSDISLFRAPQIAGTTLNQISNSENVFKYIQNKFKDWFQEREDDTEYGTDSYVEMLKGNNIMLTEIDAKSHRASKLPMFYHKMLKDKSRLSTNASQAMNAWVASAIQYNSMNEMLDILMLTEDLLLKRESKAQSGNKGLLSLFNIGGKQYADVATQEAEHSKALLYDFYERNVFSHKKKQTRSFTIFGTDISVGKAADVITSYTSFTGLAPNVLGAQANYFMGKVQMVIDGSCGEFFNLKDYAVADVKYAQMIAPYLNEINSNNKKSKLALLGEYFNAEGSFFEELKRKGYENTAVKRVFDNANWMFLYGMGEHMLHYETMLAVLNHVKIRNKSTGIETSLLEAYEVEVPEGKNNGILKLDLNQYELIYKDKEGKTAYRNLTEDDIDKVYNQIKYCNDSMHGGFSEIDKGMIHRYSFGRLLMNFRQWMPAHYARRFQGMHWDANLGEFRRGYYISCFKFLKDCLTHRNDKAFTIRSNWNMLSDMDRANVKRAITELTILVMLSAELASLGTYKDKKGNWAYRNLQYQLRRMRMETLAAVPAHTLITEGIQILNSPLASLNTLESAGTLLNFTSIFKEVEGGKHKGENKWLYDAEKRIPIASKLHSQLIDFPTEDYIFNVFK